MKKFLTVFFTLTLFIASSTLFACFNGDNYYYDSVYSLYEKEVIAYASINLSAKDVETAKNDIIEELETTFGGVITSKSESVYSDGDYNVIIKASIGSDKVLDFFATAEEIASLNYKRIYSYSYTDSLLTLNQEKTVLETRKTDLENLYNEATAITDKLAVEKEISQVNRDLNSVISDIEIATANINKTQVVIELSTLEGIDCSSCENALAIIIPNVLFLPVLVLFIVFAVKYSNIKRKMKETEENKEKSDFEN